MSRMVDGLRDLAAGYDGFIVDIWGVLHDGVTPYPAALECLARLDGRKVLLLSNAPRRSDSVRGTLRRLGVADALYTDILTSGEACWREMAARRDPWFAALGRRAWHLGPARDRGTLEGTGIDRVDRVADADFVLNTGPDDERDTQGIEAFVPELDAALARGLPMLCANPDLEIVRGGVRILCAGALAAWYESRGGNVRWIGKPDPAIYAAALSQLVLPAARVLAVGDSLRTDMAGARAAGIDALWITGGIHAAELHGADPVAEAARAGFAPVGIAPAFAW